MKKFLGVIFGAMGLLGFLFGTAFGESYPNGVEGIKGATLPPPGFYYKMTNLLVDADELMDANGDEIPIDFDLTLFATVQRFIWVSKDIKIFGGNYGWQVLIPLIYTDLEIGATGYDDDTWALGDICIEPIHLSWHEPRYDLAVAIDWFLPTGEDDDPVDPGEDMLTTMFTFGGTYYFDETKTWALSLLGRYEIHHDEYRDSGIEPGDDFHVEWGLSKTLAKVWDVGVVGYCQWQVTEDSGSGSTDDKDKAYAIGPEISMFYPPWMTSFSLRTEFEFSAEDRAEGNRTCFTIIKIF